MSSRTKPDDQNFLKMLIHDISNDPNYHIPQYLTKLSSNRKSSIKSYSIAQNISPVRIKPGQHLTNYDLDQMQMMNYNWKNRQSDDSSPHQTSTNMRLNRHQKYGDNNISPRQQIVAQPSDMRHKSRKKRLLEAYGRNVDRSHNVTY